MLLVLQTVAPVQCYPVRYGADEEDHESTLQQQILLRYLQYH